MTATRLLIVALAALGLADSASAGWDNAFQVACFRCRRERASSYYYAAPAPVVARRPAATAVTEYEQHCEYEPVTVMRPETFQEPVQVQERRTFYEPSTTYTTRSYYNPETCQTESYQIPRSSMVLKTECNTVTKYVERVRMVPVETRRKVCFRTPVTTITQRGPTTKSIECDNCDAPSGSASPPKATVSPAPMSPSPRIAPTDGVSRPMPNASRYKTPFNANTVSRPSTAAVGGEVVAADRQTPVPNADVVFLSAKDLKTRVAAKSDGYGQFGASVPPGEWHVYLSSGDGKASLYRTVTVPPAGSQFQVVSR